MFTILIVDDKESEREYLTSLLECVGYRLIEARDGLQAIESIGPVVPDLVFTDIVMPTMDGFEFIRQLRLRPETRNTPVVFYTAAYDEASTLKLAQSCTAATILPKPSDPESVLRVIQTILNTPPPELPTLDDDFQAAHLALVTTQLHQKIEELESKNADLERRVRERTAQLQVANQELEAFGYSISHDLQAPLRGIMGWSLALMEECAGQLGDRGMGYLQRVRSQSERMESLINGLLTLSRVTRTEMESVDIDVTVLAKAIADRLLEQNRDRRIEFVIQPELTAVGDTQLLDVVLTNLFNNSVKFTGRRSEARIEFGTTELGAASPFYVRDNGAGFDMAFAGKLFDPFQRFHKASDFPGTGVGLATVQRIIHRHGGRIWAESQPEQGATFYFTLSPS